ncbi:hypothetical protein FF38_02552 [Lucilia cuprina]|uniref:P-type phospholipid transporter n=1 Tax=Lucilia cuprina TaxID=7375 RepID=A0A0L0C1H6_LUCCU|nr:putative phospholipid-transporting ATPase IIB [Lucilia cuprina]KNC25284.1 hypothetical protein FF38_02552 [Lucilia cuprina]
MSLISTDLPLRDFDGESDDTDSETELLIRHHNGGGSGADGFQHLTNTQLQKQQQQQRSRLGSYSSYSQHNNTHQAPSFLSQLFGVVGGTTKYSTSSSSLSNINYKSKQTPPTTSSLLRSATASSLARDGQIRFRNERSRERFATNQTTTGITTSNITASQSQQNNAAQAAKYARSNTTKSYNLNSNVSVDSSGVGGNSSASGSFHYSDSLQMSNMDKQPPNITTTTSPNGVMQTVIDPENGSTTVFYQKNRRKSKKRSLGNLCKMCFCGCWRKWFSARELRARTVHLGRATTEKFPPNEIRNQKYNFITFLPLVLFEQFRFFLNLYFLLMALSQFIPDIRIGYPYTYWGPLGFVLTVTICREAIDDYRRHQRDREVNSQKYKRLIVSESRGYEMVPSSKIKVGDIIIVEKNERVPADLILIRTSDKSGSVFVRTDQLDGVEDRLQDGVRPTLELLRNAGVRVWMLTGDKLETACCIAKSSQLIGRNQGLHVLRPVKTRTDAHLELNQFRRKQGHALVISGESLEVCLQYYRLEFLELATACPAVVCCRCSPTQKAQVVQLIQKHTGKRTCAIGDGGNDVSMIQQADAGVGIEGREGRQASLAGDFSIPQFSHIAKLLLVHGRRSYKRSAALSQFVIHRGLIITTLQAVFSAVFYLSSVALYQGFLMVGYSTLYTMFPVFSLVLDQDIDSSTAVTYPELYKDLSKGRSLSYKTFFIWVLISIYQGGVIMYGALILFEDEFIHIVAISFTALIMTELIMVALTVRTWHRLMVLAELFSLALYLISLFVLHEYFDWEFISSTDFLGKVSIITLVSCFPLYIIKFLRKKCSPPSYLKLS